METAIMPKALTAENGGKTLLMGEFYEKVVMQCPTCDGDGIFEDVGTCEDCEGVGEYSLKVQVSWTTIKEIYAMAVEHLEVKNAPT